MNTLIETGLITEQECGNNFSYVLNENSVFSNTDYKILQGNDNGPFVKAMRITLNGTPQMFYLTAGLRSFGAMLPQLNADRFITIAANIFHSVYEVKNNGFLKMRNVDVTMEHIYIDPLTNKALLIYLPLTKGFYDDDTVFETEFRAAFAKIILGISTLTSPKTMQLFSNLQNSSIPIEHVFDNIVSLAPDDIGEGDNDSIEQRKTSLRLISMNAPEKIVLNIEDLPYTIGRSAEHADGVIKDNRMIGRTHCKVTETREGYFLEDLDSANGTSINRVRLLPGLQKKIENEDIIRIANFDFKVLID